MKMKNLRKKLNKIIGLTLSLTMVLMGIFAVSAAEPAPQFIAFTGVITDIIDYVSPNGGESDNVKLVHTKADDKNVVVFVVNEETYMVTESELKVGEKITGFYDALGIAPMIYPPQHTAAVIAVELPDTHSVTVDRFDEELTSYGETLKLNIGDKTEIIYQDGTKFEGDISELTDRKLVVVYDITTRSIPAQTTPIKVVVLYEKAIAPIGNVSVTEMPGSIDSYIDFSKIDGPEPYVNDENILMVPLRAVAESLGHEVVWVAETQSVILDGVISLTLGEVVVIIEAADPVELSTAPLLVDDQYTYVPAEFFSIILSDSDVN